MWIPSMVGRRPLDRHRSSRARQRQCGMLEVEQGAISQGAMCKKVKMRIVQTDPNGPLCDIRISPSSSEIHSQDAATPVYTKYIHPHVSVSEMKTINNVNTPAYSQTKAKRHRKQVQLGLVAFCSSCIHPPLHSHVIACLFFFFLPFKNARSTKRLQSVRFARPSKRGRYQLLMVRTWK